MKTLALGSLSNFQIKIIASLPMREPLKRAGPQDNREDRVNVARGKVQHDGYLIWLALRLQRDHHLETDGMSNLLSEIDRLIRKDPKQRERIPSCMVRGISELAVMIKLHRQASWALAGYPELGLVKKYEKSETGYPRSAAIEKLKDTATQERSNSENVAIPLKRFDLPIGRAVTEQMRSAEENLDRF